MKRGAEPLAHSKTLRRLGTLALAAAVGTAAMGAGRCAGVPDLAGSLAVAGSLLAMIPMLILYLFFQKQFVEGIAMTGGK